ncbi:amidohydrolase family protein (plasmid) [Natronosalvus rutilus]|uniref:Amidohydrolase family protein n=2 Tax=Natronosalvus rutilus TaxID=2953753 RepID=A0A9E7SZC3_9EURY|nr:amidohydrolase family protein [Natronosalvus rutilus]
MLEPKSIVERTSSQLNWFLAHGVTTVRTHVDTSSRHGNKLVEGLLELCRVYEGVVDVQIVGLPLDSLVRSNAEVEALCNALDAGVDVVGGIPHKEATREDGVEHVKTIVDLADSYDRPLDPHIDESDDSYSRFTGVLASEVEKRSLDTQVTASHLTAMHTYPNAYADKLRGLLARNDISVITNPTTNAELQGRRDDYPRRRGHTRVDELLEAGITVGIGQDNMVDKYHPYGDCDPLGEVLFLAHFGHLTSWYDVPTLWEMVIENNASILGLNSGLKPGNEGSFVLFDAPDSYNALRTRAPRRLVVREGRPVTRRELGTVYVRTNEQWESVDFAVSV